MLEDITLNPHVYFFVFLAFVGIILNIRAGYSFRKRTGTIIINPLDIAKYNNPEKRFFNIGLLIILLSFIGLFFVLSEYGHYVKHTDIQGNVTIEKRTWPYKK